MGRMEEENWRRELMDFLDGLSLAFKSKVGEDFLGCDVKKG